MVVPVTVGRVAREGSVHLACATKIAFRFARCPVAMSRLVKHCLSWRRGRNICPGWGFSRIDVSEATREIIAMRPYDDPRYWRERADEARTTASHVCNGDIRSAMVRIAVEYDQIASLVEQPLGTASEPNMAQRMASTR